MTSVADALTNFYILGALIAIGISLIVLLAKKER